MKNRKTLLTTLLAMSLIVSSFTACSGDTPPEESSKAPSTAASTSTADKEDAKEDDFEHDSVIISEPGEYPIVAEDSDVTLTMMYFGDNVDMTQNAMTHKMEEMTGVNLEFLYAPNNSYKEKVNLSFMSADVPDTFACFNGMSQIDIQKWANQELITPIDDYLENSSVHIKQTLTDNPELKEFLKMDDGQTYIIPNYQPGRPLSLYPLKLWINEEWLTRLDIEMPNTPEELKEVLIAFRDNDANGNGDPNDEYPLSFSGKGIYNLMTPFQYCSNTTGAPYMQYLEDGQVKPAFITDGYREGLKYLNSLWEEDLVDPDAWTYKGNTRITTNSIPGGKMGVIAETNPASLTYHEPIEEGRLTYVAIPPLEGEDGNRATPFTTSNLYNKASGVLITSECENPEVAVRMFDYLHSPQGAFESIYGPVGVSVKEADEGIKDYNGEQATFQALTLDKEHEYFGNTGWARCSTTYFSTDLAQSLVPTPEEMQIYDANKEYAPYAEDPREVPKLSFSADDVQQISIMETAIKSAVEEYSAKFMTGEFDIHDDEKWNEYLAYVKSYNYEELFVYYQKAYDDIGE